MSYTTGIGYKSEGPLSEVPKEGARKVWIWAVIIAFGGFLFGFDTGVISGALLFIKPEFHLNSFEQGAVVSILLIGAMVGALGNGRVADRFGRRKALGLQGAIFLIGTAIVVFATGYWMLLAGRVVLGLAVGGASATVPTYLGEISPKEIRGRILTLNQLMITIGILLAYLINVAFTATENWRAMFAVGAIPALVILLGALFVIPESPEWLLNHDAVDKAKQVICSITNEATADKLVELHHDRQQQRAKERQSSKPEEQGWHALVAHRVRPALIVGLGLAAIQQFGGINTLIYYAPTIIEDSGIKTSNSVYYSVAIGVINLLATIVAVRLIDKTGRRRLLTFSLAGMTITMALLGLSFVAHWSSLLTLVFMVAYIATFAVGLGPLFWSLIGEIFPPNAAAAGSSASTAVNWTSNFIVSLVFVSVLSAIGQGPTFWIFAVISGIGFVFVRRWVPETKDRDFDAVDADLQRRFGRTDSAEAAQSG